MKELEDACDKLLYQHANAILDLRDKKELLELELSIMETKLNCVPPGSPVYIIDKRRGCAGKVENLIKEEK